MSYQVLALKWRPGTFDEVVGQAHVTRTLKNSLTQGRVAHAYLFAGPRGVGKTSVARILAKAINCPEEGAPCGECDLCREIARGSAVDVLEIDGASNRQVADVEELRENVKFLPAYLKYKVYIIDEVHMLSKHAFNALLKTLEEPPRHVVFILATTDPHSVPLTVLSRCQRYDFRRIPVEEIAQHLKMVAEGEKAGVKDEVFEMIAKEADGSLRDSLSLMEQVLALGEDLGADELLSLLGVADRRLVKHAALSVLRKDAAACLDAVEELFRRGLDSRRFIQDITSLFRDLTVLRLSPETKSLTQLGPEDAQEVLREAEDVPSESLQLMLDLLILGQDDLKRSLQPRLALEVLLMRLLTLGDLVPLSEAVSGVENAAPQPRPAPPEPPAPPPEEPDPAAHLPPQVKEDEFSPEPPPGGQRSAEGFREYVMAKDRQLASKLATCEVREGSRGAVVLRCNGSTLLYEMLSESQERQRLARYVREYFGEDRELDIDQAGEMRQDAQDAGQELKTDLERKLHREARKHPLVEEAIRLFEGDLVRVSVGKREESEH